MKKDKRIYYNGDIITMEDKCDVEAVLIEDGIIKAVGNMDDALNWNDDDTIMVDLHGKTLMPAFIDPHSHVTSVAKTLMAADLTGSKSFEEITQRLNKFKNDRKIEDGQWITAFGYDNNILEEHGHPNKSILDKVSTTNPIVISHASGHMGVVNTLALKELGIDKNTKDPEGGIIGREGNTLEPNGYLEEKAFVNASTKIPQPKLEEILDLMDEAQNKYLENGITTAQDGFTREGEFQLLKMMNSAGRFKIDVTSYIDIKDSRDIMHNNEEYVEKYYKNLKIAGYKMFLDGSPQGKTAWLTKPYEGEKDGYKGYPVYTDDEVYKFVNIALKEGKQLITHCNGDAAADQLISCFEKAIKENGYEDTKRPVMIHAQTVRYDQLDEMRDINMIASFFVAHTYYWGDIHLKNLGKERAERISPLRTAMDKGVVCTIHQDSPVIMPNMLESIWCAVNRITKNGKILGEHEKISPMDALKTATINAAYQYFEEDKKGSIKEGKKADLVILSENPLKCPPMDIKNIKVMETIKDGVTVYKIN